jgi:hypothetical protein
LTALVFPNLLSAATSDRISRSLSGGPTVTLQGNVNRKALPKYDQGPANPELRFGTVSLLTTPTPAQTKALQQLLAEQQDRKSPNYHKWLTPEEWADRFGLSPNDVTKITAWLKAQGFTVGYVARGRNWITFSGTAAQIEQAFGTEIHKFNVNGEKHVANATSPKIPAALAGIVTGIRGLDDFFLKPRAVRNKHPLYYDPIFSAPAPADFLAPGDIATMYDINTLYDSGIDGTGQKLAIIGQTDIFITDINDFRGGFSGAFSSSSSGTTITCTCNGSNCATGVVTSCTSGNFKYVLVLGTGNTDPLTPSLGDLTESDLDIEWSMSVARNAQIIFVNAPVNQTGESVFGGVWNAWYHAVDNVTAPVISMSYGTCEFGDNDVLISQGDAGAGGPGADETELMKANSEGITFMNSSGDSGAAACDGSQNSETSNLAVGGLAVSYPASSPEVTGVGGTAISYPTGFSSTYWATSNNSNGDGGSAQNPPLPETAWNDDEELETAYGDYGGTCPTGQQGWQECYAIVATGGGPSNCAEQTSDFSDCVSGFPQPSWQTVTISGQAAVRFSPDVALAASPNFPGYIFCTPEEAWFSDSASTTSTCASGIQAALSETDPSNATCGPSGTSPCPAPSLVGGTSASTPVFAGIVTLINQYLAGSSAAGLGNINPTLYQLAKTPSNGAYHKTDTGDNNVYCEADTPAQPWPESLVCPSSGIFGYQASNADSATGYNLVTGLGSVDANNLAVAWAATVVNFSVAAGSLSPTSVAAGSSTTTTVTITPLNGFSGTVTLGCTGAPQDTSCSFNPAAVSSSNSWTSTLTISTQPNAAAATSTVTVTGTASGAATQSTTVSLQVTATTETFSVSSNLSGGTMGVTQGQTGTANLAVSSTTGFVNSQTSSTVLPVTYTCSGLPTESLCQFNGTTAPVITSATSVTLNVITTAPTAKASRGANLFSMALLPGLLGIIFVVGSHKRSLTGKLNGMRMLGLILVLGASTLWLGSCGGSGNSGGGGGNSGTPVGSSTVTVNATTGGAAPVTTTYSFTLTVSAAAN